jgi:hypothetical protein
VWLETVEVIPDLFECDGGRVAMFGGLDGARDDQDGATEDGKSQAIWDGAWLHGGKPSRGRQKEEGRRKKFPVPG